MRHLFPLLAVLAFVACATQRGLVSPGVDRRCTSLAGRCYLRASKDVVNARCTKGKRMWDDGKPYSPNDASRFAPCCTVLESGRRVRIWIAEGYEWCLAHEECHIETWAQDGFRVVNEHHARCANFGFGHDLQYPEEP